MNTNEQTTNNATNQSVIINMISGLMDVIVHCCIYLLHFYYIYTLFRQSEAAHNRYENDITDLN